MADQVVNIRHLDEVRIKFTELGAAIQETHALNDESFNAMVESLSSDLAGAVKDISNSPHLQRAADMSGLSSQYVNQVAKEFKKLSGSLKGSIEEMEATIKGTETGFGNLSRDSRRMLLKLSQEELKNRQKDSGDKKGGLAQQELGSFKRSIGTAMGKLKIPRLGSVAAGALSIMFYGYKDADRVRYEAGQVKNILIAAYDDGVKGAVSRGTQSLSTMQESLQKYLGINKKGVQSVAQSFVDGGFSVNQMLAKTRYSVLHAKDTVLSTTMALDKMFELSDGASAKRVVSFMADYGKTAEDALDSVVRLQMLGRDSGIGASQYVKNVEGASQSLAKMGYNIDNVVDIYDHVTKSFAKMGVPKQFAGKQAALGMQQVAGGIEKMSEEWKVVIGERLGYGRGLDARQKMMDAFLRVREGDSGNEVMKIIEAVYDIAMNATGGNETEARLMMEKKMGIGFEGARLVTSVMQDVKDGNLVKAAKAAAENSELLTKSLGVESEKASQFELMMNSWMKGLAKLGQGLLGWSIRMIAGIFAYIKAGMKMIENKIVGNDADNRLIANQIDRMMGGGEGSKRRMAEGIDQMIAAAKAMGSDILGDSLQTLKAAVVFDPIREAGLDQYYADMKGSGREVSQDQEELQREFGFSPEAGMKLVRDSNPLGPGYAVVPEDHSQSSQMSVMPGVLSFKGAASSGGGAVQMGGYGAEGSYGDLGGYVTEDPQGVIPGDEPGSGIVLSAGRVNAKGDIEITLGGSCPKCGYAVGGKGTSDLDALTQMLYTEGAPGRIYEKGGKEELAGIAYTALNRLRGGQGDDLMDVITSGHGFGKQGAKRHYGTNRKRTPETEAEYQKVREHASDILKGHVENPVGGATSFIHNTFGKGYGSKDPVKRTALPKFADPNRSTNKNVANIGTARFYSKRGEDAADRAKRDAAYIRKFEEWRSGLGDAEVATAPSKGKSTT